MIHLECVSKLTNILVWLDQPEPQPGVQSQRRALGAFLITWQCSLVKLALLPYLIAVNKCYSSRTAPWHSVREVFVLLPVGERLSRTPSSPSLGPSGDT